MTRKSPKQLLGQLQTLGYGRGRSAPDEEGMRDILFEALVEAVVALHQKMREAERAFRKECSSPGPLTSVKLIEGFDKDDPANAAGPVIVQGNA